MVLAKKHARTEQVMTGVVRPDEQTLTAAYVARDFVVVEIGVDALERRVQSLLVHERQQRDTWRQKHARDNSATPSDKNTHVATARPASPHCTGSDQPSLPGLASAFRK